MAISEEEIDAIADAGFDVYRHVPTSRLNSTYLYFTDGKRIGYLQQGDFGHGYSLSTVHKPSRENGTGFRVADTDDLDADTLREALRYGPDWALNRKLEIVKYRDIEEFLSERFHGRDAPVCVRKAR